MSFENPFEDYRLEPLPLREERPKVAWICPPNNIQVLSSMAVASILASNQVGQNTKVGLESMRIENIKQGAARPSHTSETGLQLFGLNSSNTNSTASFRTEPTTTTTTTTTVPDSSLVPAEDSVARFRPFQDEKWQTSFQKLLEFKHKNGHCCVPYSYKEDPALARWVKRQRHQYTKYHESDSTSTMTASRLEQLEAIGFVWHSHVAAWMEKLNELKEFRERKGHCNVPSTYPENVALSTWVKSQRRQYKPYKIGSQSTMTPLRYKILKSLGFVFEPRLGPSMHTKL